MKPDLFLHIGPAKTGTSAIQSSLWRAGKLLRQRGFLYPRQEKNHLFMVSPFMESPESLYYNLSAGRQDKKSIETHHRQSLSEFEGELAELNDHRVVLSSEHFSEMKPAEVTQLAEWLAPRFSKVTIVCYVRSPIFQLPSRLQQTVKIGRQSLEEAARSFPITAYRSLIQSWSSVFGKENMKVLPYPGDPPIRKDVVEDFLRAIGAWQEHDDFEVVSSNQSLSGAGVLIADALNSFAPRGDSSRALQKYLKRIEGPSYSPDPAVIAEVRGRAEGDAKYLEEEWGVVFGEPKIRSSTDLFDAEAIQSIARLLNDLAFEVEQAGRKVRTQPLRKKEFVSSDKGAGGFAV